MTSASIQGSDHNDFSVSINMKNLNETLINKSYKPYVWLLLSIMFSAGYPSIAQDQRLWLSAGQNIFNTRNAILETKISPANAGNLVKKWEFTTGGDVSATPAVDEEFLYFPDWAGNLYKLNAATGKLVWRREIKTYTGQNTAFARASPALAGSTLIIGTQLGQPGLGAFVLGINKKTGAPLWKTLVDDHPAAIITQSAIVYENKVYVGVASQEEALAANPTYPCCSFRGSLVCLDATSGKILWQTYMTPNIPGNPPTEPGFSGNAVWGSTPVIDVKRNSVYIATGNNYTVPQAILDCNAPGKTPDEVRACIMAINGSSTNYFDAIVSLDMTTGAVKWSNSVIPFDAWTVACFFDGPNCPENAGPDYDFGQGPALFTVNMKGEKKELLGAGQKSGIYWALNPDNGQEVWHTQVGPGGTLGGLQWGSAVDGKQIYTAVSNNSFALHTMTKGPGAGQAVLGGFWAALDAATGQVVWENVGANPPIPGFPPPPLGSKATNTGMVTLANGVMFAGAMDAIGTMYAFNAETGEKLWSFESGGSVNSGAAVVGGVVYWGSGYANFGLGTSNNKMYAFHVVKESNTSVSRADATDNGLMEMDKSISVYPSPANNLLKIVSNDKSRIQSIKLFDLTGRLVKDARAVNRINYDLDISSVPSGTYMISVATKEKIKSGTIVVAH